MKQKYLIIGLGFLLLFGSELSAQKSPTHPHLSGRAVRSPLTPGLSSVRRTKLNTQVINGVVKQNTPTKAAQRQIRSIEKRLLLRLPQYFVLGEGEGSNTGYNNFRIRRFNHTGPGANGFTTLYWLHPWWHRIYYRPPQ